MRVSFPAVPALAPDSGLMSESVAAVMRTEVSTGAFCAAAGRGIEREGAGSDGCGEEAGQDSRHLVCNRISHSRHYLHRLLGKVERPDVRSLARPGAISRGEIDFECTQRRTERQHPMYMLQPSRDKNCLTSGESLDGIPTH